MRLWGKKKRSEDKRKNKRKKQGVGPQPNCLDHLVGSYDPHGSIGGAALVADGKEKTVRSETRSRDEERTNWETRKLYEMIQ